MLSKTLIVIFSAAACSLWSQQPGQRNRKETDRVLEIRSYTLKPGMREHFHRLVIRESLPMLQRWKIDVVAYGPSLHDADSYFLMRSFRNVEERDQIEDRFYGSDEWKNGPRESILADIKEYTTVVVRIDAAALGSLRAAHLSAR